MNCRTPERNYFYLLSPETCRILELDGEGSGLCSGTLPAPGAEAPEHWVSWEQLALPSPECWDRSPVPEGVADAVGWEGGVKGQGSVSPLLLPCSAAGSVRFCQVLSLGLCVPCVRQISLSRETTPHKPVLSQLVKAELYLISLLLKLSFAAAAVWGIPVRAEAEAEHCWTPENRSCLYLSTQGLVKPFLPSHAAPELLLFHVLTCSYCCKL